MEIIEQIENWRIVLQDAESCIPMVETKTDDGEWFFPDCGFVCKYCNRCMGCARKQVMDCDDNGWYINQNMIECKNSPTGYHVVVDTDDQE